MNVAVLCERSGRVRDAFAALGHYAISCDLQQSDTPGNHIQGDCRNYVWNSFDIIIAHPPCTYLSVVANRAMKEKPARRLLQKKAFEFFMWCYWLPAKIGVCIENPVGYVNSHFRKPDQIIHPWFFGDREMKKTCLWLRGLPPLQHYAENDLFHQRTHTEKPEPKYIQVGGVRDGKKRYYTDSISGWDKEKRQNIRSATFPGIAQAMADNWGKL